jgi:hypothetical protein
MTSLRASRSPVGFGGEGVGKDKGPEEWLSDELRVGRGSSLEMSGWMFWLEYEGLCWGGWMCGG